MNERQLAQELAELATEGVPTTPDLLPHLQTQLAIVESWPRPRRSTRPRLLTLAGAVVVVMLALGLALAPTASATANQVLELFGFSAFAVTSAGPVCVQGGEQRPPDFSPVSVNPIDPAALAGAQVITLQSGDLPNLTPVASVSASATAAQMVTCPSGFELQLITPVK